MIAEFTLKDLLLIAGFVLVRDGIPWLMRTVFPAWYKERYDRRREDAAIKQAELNFRQAMAEKELELRREIAERDAIIDDRTHKTIDAIEKNLKSLTDVVAANTMQQNIMARELSSLREESHEYFSAGRKAISQIASMAGAARKKTVKRQR